MKIVKKLWAAMRAMVRPIMFAVHPEGYKFAFIFALVSVVLFAVSTMLGGLGVILTLWCVWFFRDPMRVTPQRAGLVISPADGVVNMITMAAPPPELELGDAPLPRVSVFMNVFNCHINRIPISGKVRRTLYRTGSFFNASLDKASADNERQVLLIEGKAGAQIIVVQIAGLVARRIVCWAEEEQKFVAGERFGLIRFGSRCDVYLPKGTVPLVAVGQLAIGGETILADLKSTERTRKTISS